MLVMVSLLCIFFGISSANANWLSGYTNSESRDMCTERSFTNKIDAILLDEIPSLLDECGIGGMFDFCGRLGAFRAILSSALGCDEDSSGTRSRFCNWGFNKQSAKEAFRIYRRAGEDEEGGNGRNSNGRGASVGDQVLDVYADEEINQLALNDAKLKAFGLVI